MKEEEKRRDWTRLRPRVYITLPWLPCKASPARFPGALPLPLQQRALPAFSRTAYGYQPYTCATFYRLVSPRRCTQFARPIIAFCGSHLRQRLPARLCATRILFRLARCNPFTLCDAFLRDIPLRFISVPPAAPSRRSYPPVLSVFQHTSYTTALYQPSRLVSYYLLLQPCLLTLPTVPSTTQSGYTFAVHILPLYTTPSPFACRISTYYLMWTGHSLRGGVRGVRYGVMILPSGYYLLYCHHLLFYPSPARLPVLSPPFPSTSLTLLTLCGG